MELEFISCLLCGGKNSKKLISISPFCYVQCRDCNLVYLNPRPNQNLLDKIYQKKEYCSMDFQRDPTNEEDLYFFRFSERLKEIKKFKREKGKILDIGSSWGYFLNKAEEYGWDTYGVEPSFIQARYAQEKFNLKIFIGKLKEVQFPSRYFDVVTLWHVLEHFPYPLDELLEVKKILKEDGLLAIEVPSLKRLRDDIGKDKFDSVHLPTHFFYYDITTLNLLLRKAGFHLIQAKGCGDTRILKKSEDLRMSFIRVFVVKYFRYLKGLKKIFQILRKIIKIQENIIVYAGLKAN